MSVSQLFDIAEQFVTSHVLPRFIHSIGPYAIGISATVIGLFLGTIYSDNDYSLVEFQKHMEKESYFQEMKGLFLKRDHFFEIVKMATIALVLIFIFATVLVLYLAYDLFKLKKLINIYFVKNTERLENMESVIESILKDHEVLDIKQFEFFKNEIEQQRFAFKDFITNRSLEFETTIQSSKNACIKAKNAVHSDTKKVTELMGQYNSLKGEISVLTERLEDTTYKSTTLDKDLEKLSSDILERVETIKTNSNKLFESLDDELNVQKLEVSKCNALLTCSQSLLEVSIAKFNESTADDKDFENVNEVADPVLERAIEVNNFLRSHESLEHDADNKTSSDRYRIDTLVLTLMERLSTVEENVFNHNSLITSNNIKIKALESSTSEQISDLKFHSDEWITSWVSVIYGLFNSSFLHLENELFGIDCLEYTTIFDVADDMIEENSKVLYNIMDQCKQTCLKIIKEVNLLIFEYYLIQKSFAGTNSSLILICNSKIDDELNSMYLVMERNIDHFIIDVTKKAKILATLANLKYDLSVDLKEYTQKFNILVSQNLEDFCIIHDTMKSLFKHSKHNSDSPVEDDNDDESIIEISGHSNSLLSNAFNSSCSENENSILADSSNASSLRPFKLSVSMHKH